MNKRELKWKLFQKKYKILIITGVLKGKVKYYSDDFIENLRNVCYGGIPASIIMLCQELCNGKCYDRSVLTTLGFEEDAEFRIIRGTVDGIRLNPLYANRENEPLFADHCFVEKTEKDGTTWIYDSSNGLVFDKKLYYKIENVQERHISTKEETLAYCEYQDIKNASFEDEKYSALLTLPLIEEILSKKESWLYGDKIKKEIELYKQRISYDKLLKEQMEERKKYKSR